MKTTLGIVQTRRAAMHKFTAKIGSLCIISCLSSAGLVHAAGFANQDFSISGLGLANAVVAGVGDASAASYNPSAIGWSDGLQLQVSSIGRFRNSSVKVPNAIWPNLGGSPDSVSTHITWMPHSSDFGLGASLTSPFQNSTVWTPGMPTAPTNWLRVRRATLDVVYVYSSTLSFAQGLDYYQAKSVVQQGVNRFAGKDKSAFGGHFSMNWKMAPLWRMGMMVRKAPSLQIDGGTQTMKIALPDQISLGISRDTHNYLRWELDAEWSRWSNLSDMNVRANNGTTTIAIPTSLKDTVSVKAGLSWIWRRDSAFRFGYAYDQAANNTSSFQPMIADQPGHRLSLGFSGEAFNMHFDLAYAYTFHRKQTVTGAYPGVYRDRHSTIGVAMSKGF